MYLSSLFVAATAALAVSAKPHSLSRAQHRNLRDSVPHKRSTNLKLQDTFEGQGYFNNFTFWTGADPAGGNVDYVSMNDAINLGLASVGSDGTFFMEADKTTWLSEGQNRKSVRITSNAQYTESLIIFDVYAMAWGCSVWPAIWMVGDDWPDQGELDIIEGVNGGPNNQITLHAGEGCTSGTNLTGERSPSGIIQGQTGHTLGTECSSTSESDAGCGTLDQRNQSFGHLFNLNAGAVYAVYRTNYEIAVWTFLRGSEPNDILDNPDPTTFGTPTAYFGFSQCDASHFGPMNIVIDVDIGGGWASGTFPQTCNGTLTQAIMDPTNFADAHFALGPIKVFVPE